ncbi:hypothetical protein [Desulforhopalus sp. 52FAK]
MGLINIHNRIEKALQAGRSRPDIFKELSEKRPADTAKFAYLLASIPYPEQRRKFLKINAILFLLLLILPCLILMAAWPIDLQQSTLFLTIKIVVPFLLSYFVYHFHGGVYRLLPVWCGIDLLESLLLLEFTTGYELAKIALLVLIIGVSLYLAKKVFPNLKFMGPRQDEAGRYLL